LMDDTAWATFSLSLVETMCEARVLAGQLGWPLPGDNAQGWPLPGNSAQEAPAARPMPPEHIVAALNCPNLCSGKCEEKRPGVISVSVLFSGLLNISYGSNPEY
jgi:hypothetical protein